MTPNPHLSVACGEYCVFRLGSSCNRIEFKSPAEKDLVGETVQRSSAAELLPGSTRDFFSPTRLILLRPFTDVGRPERRSSTTNYHSSRTSIQRRREIVLETP
ncbi:uncharacterized protein LOC119767558 [Culex quinquefasciatus]|uniref:uncharacterized protein LOC119767558 n=1 Tax=Culex quinquefasciatus TaxID=7176 RepID=UPI0018E343A8|nr:uncharacterized protein LOC119767558 [Culex quinquefasciatus]